MEVWGCLILMFKTQHFFWKIWINSTITRISHGFILYGIHITEMVNCLDEVWRDPFGGKLIWNWLTYLKELQSARWVMESPPFSSLICGMMDVCSISFLISFLMQKTHTSLSTSFCRQIIFKIIFFSLCHNKLTRNIKTLSKYSVLACRGKLTTRVTFGVVIFQSKRLIILYLVISLCNHTFPGCGSPLASKNISSSSGFCSLIG